MAIFRAVSVFPSQTVTSSTLIVSFLRDASEAFLQKPQENAVIRLMHVINVYWYTDSSGFTSRLCAQSGGHSLHLPMVDDD